MLKHIEGLNKDGKDYKYECDFVGNSNKMDIRLGNNQKWVLQITIY
ncbi:hypothetical protein VPH5P1C_0152 [Vibrio phage 5P1c]